MEKVTDQIIKGILERVLGVGENQVVADAKIIEDLGADSLDCVELIIAFEDTLNIEIPDEKAEAVKTVKDLYNYSDLPSPPKE